MSLRNNAFATRQNYIRGVRSLIEYYQRLPEQCTPDELIAFLVFQKNKCNFSASTVNLRVCGLKYYFRHVVNRLDLVVRIPNPRVTKYDTEILTIEEMNILHRACRDMRQLLIVSLLYDTGIRSREVIRLRVSDFDKHSKTITIRNSKGNKTRVVFYGEALKDTLNKYCKARGGVPENTLLESYVDLTKPLSLRGVQHIVKRIVKRSKIKKRISPHSFRHTYAVHFLNAGGSIFLLQKLLGHKHITTTLNYLKYATIPEGKNISLLDILFALKKKR